MTEKEELQAILSAMLLEVYPDKSRQIIKILRIIAKEVVDYIKNINTEPSTEEEIMTAVAKSLIFIAVKGKVDYP
jgi:hypothetical protein